MEEDPCSYASQGDCGECLTITDTASQCHAVCKTAQQRCLRRGQPFPSQMTPLNGNPSLCWQHERFRLRDYNPGDLVYGMNESRKKYSIFSTGENVAFVTVDMYTQAIRNPEDHDIKKIANGSEYVDYVMRIDAQMFDMTRLQKVQDENYDKEWTQQMCRYGIDFIMSGKTDNRIHFVLDDLDLKFSGPYSHTLNELRHIKASYRRNFSERIVFYRNGRRSLPPNWDVIPDPPPSGHDERTGPLRNKRMRTTEPSSRWDLGGVPRFSLD